MSSEIPSSEPPAKRGRGDGDATPQGDVAPAPIVTVTDLTLRDDAEVVSAIGSSAGSPGLLRLSALKLQVKEFTDAHGTPVKIRKDFAAAFADKMTAELQVSLKRARANGRRTLMGCDV